MLAGKRARAVGTRVGCAQASMRSWSAVSVVLVSAALIAPRLAHASPQDMFGYGARSVAMGGTVSGDQDVFGLVSASFIVAGGAMLFSQRQEHPGHSLIGGAELDPLHLVQDMIQPAVGDSEHVQYQCRVRSEDLQEWLPWEQEGTARL